MFSKHVAEVLFEWFDMFIDKVSTDKHCVHQVCIICASWRPCPGTLPYTFNPCRQRAKFENMFLNRYKSKRASTCGGSYTRRAPTWLFWQNCEKHVLALIFNMSQFGRLQPLWHVFDIYDMFQGFRLISGIYLRRPCHPPSRRTRHTGEAPYPTVRAGMILRKNKQLSAKKSHTQSSAEEKCRNKHENADISTWFESSYSKLVPWNVACQLFSTNSLPVSSQSCFWTWFGRMHLQTFHITEPEA